MVDSGDRSVVFVGDLDGARVERGGDLVTATEKARRDGPAIAVCEI
jgi:hypothetical protein